MSPSNNVTSQSRKHDTSVRTHREPMEEEALWEDSLLDGYGSLALKSGLRSHKRLVACSNMYLTIEEMAQKQQ